MGRDIHESIRQLLGKHVKVRPDPYLCVLMLSYESCSSQFVNLTLIKETFLWGVIASC